MGSRPIPTRCTKFPFFWNLQNFHSFYINLIQSQNLSGKSLSLSQAHSAPLLKIPFFCCHEDWTAPKQKWTRPSIPFDWAWIICWAQNKPTYVAPKLRMGRVQMDCRSVALWVVTFTPSYDTRNQWFLELDTSSDFRSRTWVRLLVLRPCSATLESFSTIIHSRAGLSGSIRVTQTRWKIESRPTMVRLCSGPKGRGKDQDRADFVTGQT